MGKDGPKGATGDREELTALKDNADLEEKPDHRAKKGQAGRQEIPVLWGPKDRKEAKVPKGHKGSPERTGPKEGWGLKAGKD